MYIRLDVQTSTPQYNGFRVLHAAEGGYLHELGKPAVHPSFNARPIEFTESRQRLSYNINAGRITPAQWTRIYDDEAALTNNQGFGGITPRRNYITGEDLNSVHEDGTPAYPKLLKAIIFSGTFIRGIKGNGLLTCVPGIHGIDTNKPLPSIETILQNNWYTLAVSADLKAATHFVPGTLTIIPYFLREIVTYPIEWFVEWRSNSLPDPLKFYL